MPSELAKRDIRWAKFRVWWNRWDIYCYIGGVFLMGIFLGSFAASFSDRAERIELMRRHDDDIRDFRMACRRSVDERNDKVIEATTAAADAARAAADAVNDPRTGAKK